MCHPERSEGSHVKCDKSVIFESVEDHMGIVMYYVYMLTNEYNKVLYVGVTNNLQRRLYEHKHGLNEGFSTKYNAHKLVYYETTDDVKAAIAREKQIKGWTRQKKEALINSMNPKWRNLENDWDD